MELQEMRQKLLERNRQRRAMSALRDLLTERTNIQDAPSTVTGLDGETLGTIPGMIARVPTASTAEGQTRMLGLLSDIAPDEVAGQMLSGLIPKPSGMEQKLSAIEARIGRPLTPQEVLQLGGGTTINVGDNKLD